MSSGSEALAAAFRRYIETSGACGAWLRLADRDTGEFYDWDSCTLDPGHKGPHEIIDEETAGTWAVWGAGHLPKLTDNRGYAGTFETPESSWTADELAALATVLKSRNTHD